MANMRLIGWALVVMISCVMALFLITNLKPFQTRIVTTLSSTQNASSSPTMTVPMPNGDISVNSADAETLQQLHGIGAVLALRIIEERQTHGFFVYPSDLLAVHGIGKKTLANILPDITLTIFGGTYAQ